MLIASSMDVFTKEKRSQVMSLIRAKNTKPELAVRKILHASGFRYRLHDHVLPGRPDIILRRFKTCIQVRGCFWHGHACKVAHTPGSRQSYWGPKILGNKARDKRNDRHLRAAGWKLFVIWECDCRKARRLQGKMKQILDWLNESPARQR